MPLLLGVVLLHHDLLLGAAAIGGDGRLGNGDAAPAIIAVGRRRIGITRMRHPVMGHDHAGAVVAFIICTFIIVFRRARLVIIYGIGSVVAAFDIGLVVTIRIIVAVAYLDLNAPPGLT